MWVPPANNVPGLEAILPLARVQEVSPFQAIVDYPPVKALLPVPILIAIAPAIVWFFRDTWAVLEAEARLLRAQHLDQDRLDYRPAVCLLLTAVTLTIHEYYGGRSFYETMIRPELARAFEQGGHKWLKFDRYDELYSYGWWVFARVVGYVLIPLPIWKLLFPKDSLLDMGLRLKGFFRHLWIYAMCLAVVVPLVLLIASQPDFGNYYPFYKASSRSWFDLMVWESIYAVQFFALELFFRGWMLGALKRSLGAAAIFVMAVPYCMIHYGKPYLEAHGAIVAGVVLGSLAMRTRSIYAGFLVHVSVAFLMDFLALLRRGALPHSFWPELG